MEDQEKLMPCKKHRIHQKSCEACIDAEVAEFKLFLKKVRREAARNCGDGKGPHQFHFGGEGHLFRGGNRRK
jgi:hypothetical protein